MGGGSRDDYSSELSPPSFVRRNRAHTKEPLPEVHKWTRTCWCVRLTNKRRRYRSKATEAASFDSRIFDKWQNSNEYCKKLNLCLIFQYPSLILFQHDSGTRLPLDIFAATTNGRVDLYFPRSFNGPLRIKLGNGRLRYSSAVAAMITTFSDEQGVRRSYLGPLNTSEMDRDGKWEGDELYAQSSNGNINIYFDDEVDESKSSSSKPFFKFWPFN